MRWRGIVDVGKEPAARTLADGESQWLTPMTSYIPMKTE